MTWQRRDLIWHPSGESSWAKSFVTCPTPIKLSDETIRVYVQSRDANNVGRVGYVDVDVNDPAKVVGISLDPVLDVGGPGAFDESGVFQTSVMRLPDGHLAMYYVGFELGDEIRYRLFTGLAISDAEGVSFQKVQSTPILASSAAETTFRCGPHVLYENGVFRMWYIAGSDWEELDGKPVPNYDIRYVESEDGVCWPDKGTVIVEAQNNEYGFGRPYVVQTDLGYEMYFSVRLRPPNTNRIAYARSVDGVAWTRCDGDSSLTQGQGWDEQGSSFPSVIRHEDREYCFYNGPNFGETGFGWAERMLS